MSPANAVPPVSVCESAPQNYPVVWQFDAGWNLIGNPFDEPVSIGELFRYDANLVNGVYTADIVGFHKANKDHVLQPGQACWVYLDNAAHTNIDRTWVDLKILTPDSAVYYASSEYNAVSNAVILPFISQSLKQVQLHAVARQARNAQYKDVAESAEWSTSDPSVATVDKGMLFMHAPGVVEITALYHDAPMGRLSLAIVDGQGLIGMRFNIGSTASVSAASATRLQVIGTFFSGTPQCPAQSAPSATCDLDITDDVQITVDNPSAGAIQDKYFQASLHASNTRITAIYKDNRSVQSLIHVSAFSWDNHPIQISRKEPFPPQCNKAGQNVFIIGQQAALEPQNFENIRIKDNIEWFANPPGYISMQGNIMSAQKPGTVQIQALINQQLSERVTLTIKPRDEPLCITANPSNNILLPLGASVSLSATAYYARAVCNQDVDPSEFCSRDISKEVAWSLSNPSGGHIESTTFHAAATPAHTEIKGEFQGEILPVIPVFVFESRFQFLDVYVGGAHSLEQCPVLMTESTINGCYSLMTDRDITLRVTARQSGNMHTRSMDMTHIATWTVSDQSIARVSNGVLTPLAPGLVWVQAHVGDTSSSRIHFMILGSEPMRSLLIGTQYAHTYGDTRKLPADACTRIVATLYTYGGGCATGSDCFNVTAANVTRVAGWIIQDPDVISITPHIPPNPSDKRIMNCIQPKKTGQTLLRATYQDVTSNTQNLEIWGPNEFPGCGSSTQSLAQWNDRYSSAKLQTCAAFGPGEPVAIQYKAWLENDAYYIDTCLDLYITDEHGNIVRTLREEGCTSESVHKFAARRLVYDHLATWDRMDDSGNPVAPGGYNAVARFAILYDPVIRVPFQLLAPMDENE